MEENKEVIESKSLAKDGDRESAVEPQDEIANSKDDLGDERHRPCGLL